MPPKEATVVRQNAAVITPTHCEGCFFLGADATHVQYTRIAVKGYTDTSGTPRYDIDRSLRRAQAVAGELVHDAVPASAITIRDFGQTTSRAHRRRRARATEPAGGDHPGLT